jgi:hypothetical protein
MQKTDIASQVQAPIMPASCHANCTSSPELLGYPRVLQLIDFPNRSRNTVHLTAWSHVARSLCLPDFIGTRALLKTKSTSKGTRLMQGSGHNWCIDSHCTYEHMCHYSIAWAASWAAFSGGVSSVRLMLLRRAALKKEKAALV